jgi:hypothetical protein
MRSSSLSRLEQDDILSIFLEHNRLLKENNELLRGIDEKLRKIAFNTNSR